MPRKPTERRLNQRIVLTGGPAAGKTAVAVLAALVVAESGGQTAFLAPTELLAEQHAVALAPGAAMVAISVAPGEFFTQFGLTCLA